MTQLIENSQLHLNSISKSCEKHLSSLLSLVILIFGCHGVRMAVTFWQAVRSVLQYRKFACVADISMSVYAHRPNY